MILFTVWSKLETVNLALVLNKFKFLCNSGTLGLEVTNTPRTAKVVGSNLTRPVFFKREVPPISKNCQLVISLRMFCC